ncbi:MAG: hypothetical protein QGH99_10505 [Pseudomonadales bacterium]|nr:hypothetical protein [Pseudomonadales bacterium]MDP6316158.1 hypothetical protein [Pseudomonadales bacterium]MDP7315628.1 hypothetical protein [Pseudomonadales bacterium]MDP7577385.1 hypothetical protein [Pseudomonadales bacterium]HJP50751.1 hypothetical protein [Pseudomonadales bacterium]
MSIPTGSGQTTLAPDEILKEIRIPYGTPSTTSTFIKWSQPRSMAISIANLSTSQQETMDTDNGQKEDAPFTGVPFLLKDLVTNITGAPRRESLLSLPAITTQVPTVN